MPVFQTVEQGVRYFDSVLNGAGGDPQDWSMGISRDAVRCLDEHGLYKNPYQAWAEFPTLETAQAVVNYFQQTGIKQNPDDPSNEAARQVYLYRQPRAKSLSEFLKEKASEEKQQERRKRKEDWVDAVNRFLHQIGLWLKDSDPHGLLDVIPTTIHKLESGLGAYQVSGIQIVLGDAVVKVEPVARNVVASVELSDGGNGRAEGRIDITDGARKYILYRTLTEAERWYAVDQQRYESRLFDQARFEAILQELLS